MERKYSVAEIDRMREAIKLSYPTGVSYYQAERNADTEDRLRTYMLAGVDPEDLEAWNAALWEAEHEAELQRRGETTASSASGREM